MLTIFNRAELLITYDLARFCQVRDALQAAGIDFTYKVRNRTSPTMTASGSRERFGNANIRPPGPTGLGANFFEAIGAIHVCFIGACHRRHHG